MDKVSKQKELNYGIELLRIVSMMMIVTLHVLGRGGVLEESVVGSAQYHVAYFVEISCYCAVNCYALISGYVMFDSKFKYGKFIMLMFQGFFYSLGITIVYLIIKPEYVNVECLIKSLFPILTKQWWYLSAYAGMYLFIPFMNFIVSTMKKKEVKILNFSIVLVFSFVATVASKFTGDLFGTSNGYSTLWLMLLYILGASIKKYEKELLCLKRRYTKLCIGGVGMLLVFITFSFHNFTIYLPEQMPGKSVLQTTLLNYISPTVLGSAICLLLMFSSMKITSTSIRRFAGYVGRLTFGVYLIHEHPLIANTIMTKRFTMYAKLPLYQMIPCIILTVITIFSICALLEGIRYKLFAKMRVKEYVLNRVKI